MDSFLEYIFCGTTLNFFKEADEGSPAKVKVMNLQISVVQRWASLSREQ